MSRGATTGNGATENRAWKSVCGTMLSNMPLSPMFPSLVAESAPSNDVWARGSWRAGWVVVPKIV